MELNSGDIANHRIHEIAYGLKACEMVMDAWRSRISLGKNLILLVRVSSKLTHGL
jgi:hypothetical protein